MPNITTNHAITYTNSKWQPQFLRNIPRGKRVKYPVQEKKRVSSKSQSQVNRGGKKARFCLLCIPDHWKLQLF